MGAIKRVKVFLLFCVFSTAVFAQKEGAADRKLWLAYMDKLARPVFENLAAEKLKQNMLVVLSKKIDNKESRTKAAYLEAFGRTLSGIAPWLNGEGGTGEEVALRKQYRQWAV